MLGHFSTLRIKGLKTQLHSSLYDWNIGRKWDNWLVLYILPLKHKDFAFLTYNYFSLFY